jgi:FixJ family two-component response regulator
MMIPENEKTEKNRKIYAQKFTVDQQKIKHIRDSIEKRRNLVYQLSLQGHSNDEIAKQLQVSLSTVEKDLRYMRWHCLKWTQDIVTAGAIKPMFDSYTRIEIAQKELWSMYREEKDTKIKRQILSSIVANSIKQDKLTHGHYLSEHDEQDIRNLETSLDEEIKEGLEK